MAKRYDIVPMMLAAEELEPDSWLDENGLGCIDVDLRTGRAFTYWRLAGVPAIESFEQEALAHSTIKELIRENI